MILARGPQLGVRSTSEKTRESLVLARVDKFHSYMHSQTLWPGIPFARLLGCRTLFPPIRRDHGWTCIAESPKRLVETPELGNAVGLFGSFADLRVRPATLRRQRMLGQTVE